MIRFIVPLLVVVGVQAQEIAIKPNHPDRYEVRAGDTLWDISGKFLQHPGQWPQIWHSNPQIKNPDLIYPGDVLVFSMFNGRPQLSLAGRTTSASVSADNKPLFYPHARESAAAEAIHLIPISAISPYLSSPRVVGEHDMDDAPYVIKVAGEHLIAGAGDRVFVRSITEPESLTYIVYRPGKPYKDADTDEILGYEAEYIADLTIERSGDPATLRVDKTQKELMEGDRVMISEKGNVALNYFPRQPEKEITGSIISVLDGVTQIGRYDLVVLDRGKNDGLEAGHVLNIYHGGDILTDHYSPVTNELVKMPDELAGIMMVFRTFDRVSYALVMEASHALNITDRFSSL